MSDIVFRYSTLSTAYDCQYKFYLKHVLKLEPEEEKSIDLEFGTAIHAAIAAAFTDGCDPVTVFRIHWASVGGDGLKQGRYSYSNLSDIGEKLMSKWHRMHFKNFKPLHIERGIEWELAEFKMSGTPDFIGYYKGKLSIVDWKTSHARYTDKKLLTDEQMFLYAFAAAKLGLAVEQVVYAPLIKYGAAVQNPLVLSVNPEYIKTKLVNVADHMRQLTTTGKYIKNRKHCGYCPMWSQCEGKET